MNVAKILLQGEELDIKGDFGFGLNYSVGDVKEPSKRNAPYSKTVTLIGSKNNNRILGGLFDVNADFTFFNPNFKTQASIVVDSTTVINGFLRLVSIDVINENFIEGDFIEYKCVISSSTVDFFSQIKNKDLSDLDFPSQTHTLNYTNIVDSWNNTASDVYTYPILHKNSSDYFTSDFKAAIFQKAYLKKIATVAGYQLTGDLLDETTAEGLAFSKDIITYNGDAPTITETERIRRRFKASSTAPLSVGGDIITTTNTWIPWTGFGGLPFANLIEHENDSTGVNYDNGNNYDIGTIGTSHWDVDRTGNYIMNCNTDFELSFTTTEAVNLAAYTYGNAAGGYDLPAYTPNTEIFIGVGLYVNNVLSGVEQYTTALNFPSSLALGLTTLTKSLTYFNESVYLLSGDVVTFKATLHSGQQFSSNLWIQYEPATATSPTNSSVSVDLTADTSVMSNGVSGGILVDGDEVELKSYIPKNIKQSDILTDIIKRYNAYITIDEDNDRLIRVETRDGYYARGTTLDWTNKKDFSERDTIVLLSELQNKEVELTYKKSEDEYSKRYSAGVGGDIYGVQKIKYDNEFVTGTKKIESPFGSSPLVYSDSDNTMVLSSIDSSTPKTVPKVLHYGGLINTLDSKTWSFTHITGGVSVVNTHTTYPYAGHLDNPINPTLDINFGDVPYEWYSSKQSNTTRNLYNRFWKNYIEQINEGKKVTMSFDLSEVDISFIKDNLNSRIFVRDAYYYINKIKDYNPIVKRNTKVELLKVKEANTFAELDIEIGLGDGGDTAPYTGDDTRTPINSTDEPIVGSDDGIVIGTETQVFSSSNYSLALGEENTIGSASPYSMIIGSNNTISSRVSGGFIFGTSNKTITEANTGYIGETFYRNGLPASPENSYLLADAIALRDAGTLMEGVSYFCSDIGLTFKAIDSRTLNFLTYKSIKVIKGAQYLTLETFITGKSYIVGDIVIWGGRVWELLVTQGLDTDPIDDFNLPTAYFEMLTDVSYYDFLTIGLKFDEYKSRIHESFDGKGNVVRTFDEDFHFLSDWGNDFIYNNETRGFVNNDVNNIVGNRCGVIKNNALTGEISENRNNGDITDNTNSTGFSLSITNNVNNGSIDFNNATASIVISNNVNNGYIGNATMTNRAVSITDTTLNK